MVLLHVTQYGATGDSRTKIKLRAEPPGHPIDAPNRCSFNEIKIEKAQVWPACCRNAILMCITYRIVISLDAHLQISIAKHKLQNVKRNFAN